MSEIVGGGAKKVLYTLSTLKRIGLKKSAKALRANNTCKACGLGMGGQKGGMTNELDEFPSVCNKSIQAQSTDIQPPIPDAIFKHSLSELRELSPHQFEHIGRLNTPIYKATNSQHYQPVSWDWALDYAAQKFAHTQPAQSFFYASGRSSNEAGFVLQLLARAYGTNNVNNCSYYCHQATGVGLGSTIGSGTATVELDDLSGCDLVFVIGANPASNHPRFIHQLKNLRDRNGKVVVINPAKEPGLVKFSVPKSPKSMIAGGTEIASHYVQPNIGSDEVLLHGIAKAVLALGGQDDHFLQHHCENHAAFIQQIHHQNWSDITQACGVSQQDIQKIATVYCNAKKVIFAWGMGITHHQNGCNNVEAIANLALLRGMVGGRYKGLLPLRGHSNVQGIGSIGVKPILADAVIQKMQNYFKLPPLSNTHGLDTFAALKQAHKGQIRAALIMGGNLYGASPNAHWAEQALNAIDFKLMLTTTLNQGHLYGNQTSESLVLPVCARDEEPQSTTQESMFNYVRLSDGGITRLDNVRSEVSILSELANRILPHSPIDFLTFKNHNTVRQAIANILPELAELKDIGHAKREFHIKGRLKHTPQFNRPNGRAFMPANARTSTHDKIAKPNSDYPFLLATIRSEGQFNTIIYEEQDSYRYNATRNSVLMNPDDVKRLGLKEYETITVASAHGQMQNALVRLFDLPPNNLMAYFPEANVLTEHKLDPRSHTPNFKSVAVKIIKE